MSFFPYRKIHALVSMVTSGKDGSLCVVTMENQTMLNNPNTLLSKAEWCRYCIHLTDLNLSHFTVAEAMGLEAVASRPPAMASSHYKILSKSIKRTKIIRRTNTRARAHTHIHT
jgi:hypothetical protein